MTLIVGIDIAKYHHECMVTNDQGEVLHKPFTFDNNHQGFTLLHSALTSLGTSETIKIGFEATGHYGSNLRNFLIDHGYDFMEIHPVLMNRFTKSRSLRKTKTDKIDVKLICSYLTSVDFQPYLNKSYHINSLKSLTRSRDALIKERSLQLVRMTNVLDITFPEFKPFFKNSLKSATAMYLLENFGSAKRISRLTIDSYNKMASLLRRTISYPQFLKLKELAKSTVGAHDDLFDFQLSIYLKLYQSIDFQLTQLEKMIEHQYSLTNSFIHTVPGISIQSAASIYSEIGDIKRFPHPDKLISFCGLEPALYQSGETEYTGKMVKRGSSYLRQYLMNCAATTILHSSTLYDFYRRKRNEGKSHRVALSHVTKKLIRIIYKLETDQISFNEQQMR